LLCPFLGCAAGILIARLKLQFPADHSSGDLLNCHIRDITSHTVEISIENRVQFGPPQILTTAIATKAALTISADEMKYNQDTGEIEPRGNVRVKLN
jgi:hypothetical protein